MKRILIFIALFLFCITVDGRPKEGHSYGRSKDVPAFKYHLLGGVWTVESNYGAFGDPSAQNPSFDYPGGFGYYYQYKGGIWFGTEIAATKYVSSCFYDDELDPDDGDLLLLSALCRIRGHFQ